MPFVSSPGTWSTWGDEFVDESVPSGVVLLDQNNGTSLGDSVLVPAGSYALFLVGNNNQLCDEGERRVTFSHGVVLVFFPPSFFS